MTLNLANTPRISVQALVGEGVGSVRFQVDGKTFRIENTAPYMINGDDNDTGLPNAWVPTVGQHVLRITPYSGVGASGVMGATRVITINVTSGAEPGELFKQFVNFQPDGPPVPSDYRTDIGRVFGVRKNGLTYGWSEPNEANMIDRNDPDAVDQRFDTFAEVGDRTWSIQVPNGTYSVYANCSDRRTAEGSADLREARRAAHRCAGQDGERGPGAHGNADSLSFSSRVVFREPRRD